MNNEPNDQLPEAEPYTETLEEYERGEIETGRWIEQHGE